MNDTDRCMVSKWNGAPHGIPATGTARRGDREYGVCDGHTATVEAAGYVVTRKTARGGDPMTPTVYVSKNITGSRVEAVQLTDDVDWQEVADWCSGRLVNHRDPSDEYETTIKLDGGEYAEATDWVCKLPSGEFTVWMDMEFESLYRLPEEATR